MAFIYREDFYNPDTDRKNITDIIVKKHRNGPTGAIELYLIEKNSGFVRLSLGRAKQRLINSRHPRLISVLD